MPTTRRPRKGTLQFWPRKRARRLYPRVRWHPTALNCFCGYKVGMTHAQIIDNSNAPTKNSLISVPVTILECPPLKILGLRFYKKIDSGLKAISDLINEKLDKELARKIKLPKKQTQKIPEEYDEIRLIVYTQPKLIGFKKKPELFEVPLDTKDIEPAKQFLDKELKISDVFKSGQQLDVHAVTKGKGYQGPTKRFHLSLRQHKSEKTKRGPGSLGPWHPSKVSFAVPHAGQTGLHTRTEYNKWLIKIIDPTLLHAKGGFTNYGLVKNDCALIKGSIPGAKKRLVILTESFRPNKKIPAQPPEVQYVSLESKQG